MACIDCYDGWPADDSIVIAHLKNYEDVFPGYIASIFH